MIPTIHVDAIEQLPTRYLLGNCAILNVTTAQAAYKQLWQLFMSKIEGLDLFTSHEFYGVCTNLQINGYFEYWTAVDATPNTTIPLDLVPLPLAGGTYGSLVELSDRSLAQYYGHRDLFCQTPTDYTLNWQKPFFELFSPKWNSHMAVKFCLPLQSSYSTSIRI